jgi:4-amino-4-deoxy-L-arabinose transferase-like glycosyltransferase
MVRFQRWSRTVFNKWRLMLLVFLVVYGILLVNFGSVAIQWDEMPHLRGAQVLAQGRLNEYISTYGYYPPLYDLVTSGFFKLLGMTVHAGRLAAATFALLAVWIVFEFAYRTYGPKNALISAILLGSMPGFFLISHFAMLETMLVFFFSLTMFFFLSWIRVDRNKALILAGLTLGIGFLAKYEILVAGIVMIGIILVLFRKQLSTRFSRFWLLVLVAILVAVPWLLIIGSGKASELLYAIQVGGEDRAAYSTRFPLPVFYLIEMTWPYGSTHPIFLTVFALGLIGLGLWGYRRKTEDKFFLTWFIIVYVFFTLLIPNKNWRYVMPLFPVLAISAAGLVTFLYDKIHIAWNSTKMSPNRRLFLKFSAAVLVAFTVVSMAYSFYDGYEFVARYQISIPVDQATNFVSSRLSQGQSVVVLCASNSFSVDVVKFYLEATWPQSDNVWQYPKLAIDAFTPEFDVNELTSLCEEKDAKYLLLYEYGGSFPYFNSTLTTQKIFEMVVNSGRFTYVTSFGESPTRIFILTFA